MCAYFYLDFRQKQKNKCSVFGIRFFRCFASIEVEGYLEVDLLLTGKKRICLLSGEVHKSKLIAKSGTLFAYELV